MNGYQGRGREHNSNKHKLAVNGSIRFWFISMVPQSLSDSFSSQPNKREDQTEFFSASELFGPFLFKLLPPNSMKWWRYV